MASLFRRSRSSYWQAAFTDRDGVRIYRSTGESKKTDARDRATAWELKEKKARLAQLDLQAEYTSIIEKAGVEANKGALTLDKARGLIQELYKAANHEELPDYTIGQWLDKWLKDVTPTIANKTVIRYTSSIKGIKKALGKKAGVKLQLFSTQHAKSIRSSLIKTQGKSRNATVNVKLTDFKSALTAARKEGLTERNVGQAIRLLPEDDSKIVTHFELHEVGALIDAAKGDWKTVILIAATTGLRLTDIVTLDWTCVHLQRGCLILSPGKQQRKAKKKTVTVPLNEKVVDFLEAKEVTKKKGYVFEELATKSTSTHSTNFSNLMKRTDISKQVTLENGDIGHRSFHSLRHSFATWLRQADVEKDVRKSLMAHSKDEVHQIYTAHDEDTLRRAVGKLPVIKFAA